MTLYEADFRITHDCPHVRLSLRYPSTRIYVWCNFQNEIIEIVSANASDFNQILDDTDITEDAISRSSNNNNIHLLKKTCNCTIKNSIGKNAELANVMHLNPSIVYRGWEYHRIIAFEHENLVEFMNHLEKNVFTY
jgi:predicted DNA binding protein